MADWWAQPSVDTFIERRDPYQTPGYVYGGPKVGPTGPYRQYPYYHGGMMPSPHGLPYGDDMGTPTSGIPIITPTAPVVDPATGQTNTPVTTVPAAGFDISGLMSGTTFGLPTWLVIGGAVWFFFLRKGR